MLFTDTSHYAYSSILTQTGDSPEDLRPVTFTSDSFKEMQQRWCVNENRAYVIYQSVLKFDLYLRGANCVLYCDQLLLEPFCLKALKFLNSTGSLSN